MTLNCEVNIKKNVPARLLSDVIERMDYSKLYAAYFCLRKIERSPTILLKKHGICASKYPVVRRFTIESNHSVRKNMIPEGRAG